jgi:hypothetical protein
MTSRKAMPVNDPIAADTSSMAETIIMSAGPGRPIHRIAGGTKSLDVNAIGVDKENETRKLSVTSGRKS